MVWCFLSFSFCLGGQIILRVFTPFAEWEISDYIAHGLIIRGFTVRKFQPAFSPLAYGGSDIIRVFFCFYISYYP